MIAAIDSHAPGRSKFWGTVNAFRDLVRRGFKKEIYEVSLRGLIPARRCQSDRSRLIRWLVSDISVTACLKPERHPRMIERAL